MKKAPRYILIAVALFSVAWAYAERGLALSRFSRLTGTKNIGSSSFAKDYRSAGACIACDIEKERRKIRWDLWCIGMAADIDPPSRIGERLFLRVRATDRSDTEFIYVFDASGEVVEVARIPLA